MKPLILQERELMSRLNMIVGVKVKRDWRVRFGLWLIWLGCKWSGINFEEKDNPE